MMKLLNIDISWNPVEHVAPDVNLWYDKEYVVPGFELRGYYNGDGDDNLPLLQKINVAAEECLEAIKEVINSDGSVSKRVTVIISDEDIHTVIRIIGEITDALTEELMKRKSA